MFGQTSSNTSRSLFGSTNQFQFGVPTSTPLWGAPIGSSSSSTGFAAFSTSTAQTSRSFGDFAATTQPSQSAPGGNIQFAFGTSISTNTSASPAFGQRFGGSNSPFWAQSTTQAVGNSAFAGGQRQGTRVVAYKATNDQDGTSETFKLQSITAMSVYQSKSMDELRFEDYQLGDKGGKTTMKASTPFNSTPSFSFPQPSFSSPSSSTVSSTPATNAFRSFNPNQTSSSPWTSVSSTPKTNAFTYFNPNQTSPSSPWTSPSLTPATNVFTSLNPNQNSSSPWTSTSSTPATNAFTSSAPIWTSSSPSMSSCSTPATNAFIFTRSWTSSSPSVSSSSTLSTNAFPWTSSSPSVSSSPTPATNGFTPFTPNWISSSPSTPAANLKTPPTSTSPFSNPFNTTSTPTPFSFPSWSSSSPSTSSSTPVTNVNEAPTPTFSFYPQPSSNPFNTSNSTPPFSFPSWSSSSPSTTSSTPATNIETPPTPTPSSSSISQPFPNLFNTSKITPPPSFPSWTSSQVTTSPSPPVSYTYTTPTPSIPQTQTPTSTSAPSPTPGSNILNITQPQQTRTSILQQNDLQQQQPVTNIFGAPRASPQVSNGGSVQYGISSIPVVDRPAATRSVRVSMCARHLVQRRIGCSAANSRRYDPYRNTNASSHPKLPFFSDDADQVPKTPKIIL